MDIDYSKKQVKLAVRELASFQLESGESEYTLVLERAKIGQRIHSERAKALHAIHKDALRIEVPFKKNIVRGNWTFILQGRIDQWLQTEQTNVIREIKTVNYPLMVEDGLSLRERYPEYFTQLAIYADTFRVKAELEFISILDNSTKLIELDTSDFNRLESQWDALCDYLDTRAAGHRAIHASVPDPVFPEIREEQGFAADILRQAVASKKKPLFFEAPTGFGKTGISLHLAMERLQKGLADRIVFLSGKSTGQWEAMDYLKQYQTSVPLKICHLRNKDEHAIATPAFTSGETVLDSDEIRRRFFASGINAGNLFRERLFTVEHARRLGELAGIEPFWISKYALCHADVWIADYNYVFSPTAAGVLENIPDFQPKRTILIIDEAHNLPERVRGLFHLTISAETLAPFFHALQWAGCERRLLAAFDELLRFIENLQPSESLNNSVSDHLEQLFSRVREFLPGIFIENGFLDKATRNALGQFYQSLRLLKTEGIHLLFTAPHRGSLQVFCLDAAAHIHRCLKDFTLPLLMSATLQPIDDFKEECGLADSDNALVIAESKWQRNAIVLAADTRVDTRFSSRNGSYPKTAETLYTVACSSVNPVAVFFPSFRYAQTIAEYLHQLAPNLTIAMQPRGVTLDEQDAFIRESLIASHMLFLVLGSTFSESINALGGNIDFAVIVSPGIPEPDALNKAKEKYLRDKGIQAIFHKLYLVPAMRRIKQAIGRLARSPEHRVKVLLHCKRFAQAEYQRLIVPEDSPIPTIRSDENLNAFLKD